MDEGIYFEIKDYFNKNNNFSRLNPDLQDLAKKYFLSGSLYKKRFSYLMEAFEQVDENGMCLGKVFYIPKQEVEITRLPTQITRVDVASKFSPLRGRGHYIVMEAHYDDGKSLRDPFG